MRKFISVFTLLQCYRGILVVVTHISDDVHIVMLQSVDILDEKEN